MMSMSNQRQFCSFFVQDLLFGVEVTDVQEVIRYQEMTPVPLAPDMIRGLINLRGQIVTAIDMRVRLDVERAEDGRLPMNVVIQTEDGPVSLLVDEIDGVLGVNEGDFEDPPENLRGSARDLIKGAYKLDGQLLLILDVQRVIAVEN